MHCVCAAFTSAPVSRIPDVVVVGSANVDLVAHVETLPRAGETVLARGFTRAPGGKGANQAIAAARLGARVAFAGCIGDDADGRLVRDALAAEAIDLGALFICGEPTGTALIAVDAKGANTIIVASGANARCETAIVDIALEGGETGILVVQHETPKPLVSYALTQAKRRGLTTILNPAPARAIDATDLHNVDYLTPNASEATALSGVTVDSLHGAKEAAARLLAGGARNVIVTLGEDGAYYAGTAGSRRIEAFAVAAIDSTGAGDAYNGAFAAALSAGRTLDDALIFASAAAAVSVTREGAQASLPTRAEAETMLARR